MGRFRLVAFGTKRQIFTTSSTAHQYIRIAGIEPEAREAAREAGPQPTPRTPSNCLAQ